MSFSECLLGHALSFASSYPLPPSIFFPHIWPRHEFISPPFFSLHVLILQPGFLFYHGGSVAFSFSRLYAFCPTHFFLHWVCLCAPTCLRLLPIGYGCAENCVRVHKFPFPRTNFSFAPRCMLAQPAHTRAVELPLVHSVYAPMRTGCEQHHGVAAVRRCPERGSHGVPDQPGAVPPHPLPSGDLRPHYQV